MAPPYTSTSEKPKRIRKRKARTDVSSSDDTSSDSDSDSDSASSSPSENDQSVHEKAPQKAKRQVVAHQKSKITKKPSESKQPSHDPSAALNDTLQQSHHAAAEEAFDSFYLRQITTEFAQDLDKVRSAGDFNNKSIQTLVTALKQGRSTFTKDERISAGTPLATRQQ